MSGCMGALASDALVKGVAVRSLEAFYENCLEKGSARVTGVCPPDLKC